MKNKKYNWKEKLNEKKTREELKKFFIGFLNISNWKANNGNTEKLGVGSISYLIKENHNDWESIFSKENELYSFCVEVHNFVNNEELSKEYKYNYNKAYRKRKKKELGIEDRTKAEVIKKNTKDIKDKNIYHVYLAIKELEKTNEKITNDRLVEYLAKSTKYNTIGKRTVQEHRKTLKACNFNLTIALNQ